MTSRKSVLIKLLLKLYNVLLLLWILITLKNIYRKFCAFSEKLDVTKFYYTGKIFHSYFEVNRE